MTSLHNTYETAWRVGLAFAIICSMSACIPKNRAGEVLAPRGQLVFRAKTFNRFLRWKAYDRAKQFVSAKQRGAFMLQCERDRPHIRITDFRVRDVSETKKGKKAIVLVIIHRHRLPSVSVQRVIEQQRWESKGGYWFFVGLKETTNVDKAKKPAPRVAVKKPAPTPAPTPRK